MEIPHSFQSFWDALSVSGMLTGGALTCLIVILVVFAAQIESLLSACRQLNVHRAQLLGAKHTSEFETKATLDRIAVIEDTLPELAAELAALDTQLKSLLDQAADARRLRVREVIVSDVFIQPADRPFIAKVQRPEPEPGEPLAELWQAGRDYLLYGSDKKVAERRFQQRFPPDRGFIIGPLTAFEIAWTRAPEQAAEMSAMATTTS